MSNKSAPNTTTGARKVTFSNIVLQTGHQDDYKDFEPSPVAERIIYPLGEIGTHSVDDYFPDFGLTLQVTPSPMKDYQVAVLRTQGEAAVLFHACLDAVSASSVWPIPQMVNNRFLSKLAATTPAEVVKMWRALINPDPQLSEPSSAFMVTSFLPAAGSIPGTVLLSTDFARHLFWSLWVRHVASANVSA